MLSAGASVRQSPFVDALLWMAHWGTVLPVKPEVPFITDSVGYFLKSQKLFRLGCGVSR
ncbi:hypothetical protein [Acidomonas methanolica]|uniref:hypothetical protein n=1 Tax=Acidomonas methanolica TaxID=437 RepID=UPI00130D5E70|nr:hypothetical protein [Acidomonas methanolica]MBU2655291.1 hypothetical protein [Acidomonas methanolica]